MAPTSRRTSVMRTPGRRLATTRKRLDGPEAGVSPVLFPVEGGAVWAYLVSCVIREPELVDLRVFVRDCGGRPRAGRR